MGDLIYLAGIVLAILGAAVYSGAETGLYALSRVRLQFNLARSRRGAVITERLVRDRQQLICTLLLGTNITLYLVSLLSQILLKHWVDVNAEVVSTVVLTPFLFIVAEAVPKNAFRIRSDPLVYKVAPVLFWSSYLLRPLTLSIGFLARGLSRWLGGGEAGPELLGRRALKTLFSQGEEEGMLSGDQRVMAANIIELRDSTAASVMVPVGEYPAIEVGCGGDEILEMARRVTSTRILVFEGTPEHVIGMVHLYDVLLDLEEGLHLASRVRDVPRLPPTTPLTRILELLVSSHQHLVLIEERGRAVGVVTTKDVVEEIVGELRAM